MRHATTIHSPTTLPALALPRVPAMAFAASTIAALDLGSCAIYWTFHGVSPLRVARGPAAWIIGADAARAAGGWGVVLGVCVLMALALLEVAGYRWAAARAPQLLQRPVRWGMAYGAFAFAVVQGVLIPLSAAPARAPDPAWMVVLLGIHVFLIGIACALFARWMARS